MLDDPPVVGIGGAPGWAGRAERPLRAGGYVPVAYPYAANWPLGLIDDYPALLLVDAAEPNWAARVAAVTTEQATRRMPVLVVAPDMAFEAAALRVGAAGMLALADLDSGLLDCVRAHARRMDSATRAALACQCQKPLPPLAQLGVKRFNAGAYYAQHDAFEEQWMAEPGPVRDLYRTILQVGVAYYHITRGNHAGALKMLQRSVQWFAQLPDVCQGVDVRQLRQDAARVRHALKAMPPDAVGSFDRSLLQPVRLVNEGESGVET
ncbi:MAG: DUF309 domain-containing protein [Chloroflexota bacterium]